MQSEGGGVREGWRGVGKGMEGIKKTSFEQRVEIILFQPVIF